ncbi:MAG: hypothetical protein JHC31_12600 [Sulfurihydrogenibium sp.]|jgi:hypothetical protein|nr:hypothetical protein [Sulfurihydrogenibium sp.]
MKNLLKVVVLLTAGFSVAFADPNQNSEQKEKVVDQKSAEIKQDALERLNKDLDKIPQSVKDCVFKAATIEQLKACHK